MPQLLPSFAKPSAFMLALAVLLSVAPAPAAAEVASVLLDVPWRTQIDGHPDQRENAGLACLGMVLDAYGRPVTTAELRSEYDRLVGTEHAPTAAPALAGLGTVYGLQPFTLGAPPELAVAALRHQLERGNPVILDLGKLPRPGGERWVLAVGYLATGEIVFQDPGEPVAAMGQMLVLRTTLEHIWLQQGAGGIVVPAGQVRAAQAAAPGATNGTSPFWWNLVEAYARWFGLDPYYVAAVALAESGGDPDAVGDQGHSVGLMQLHDGGFGAGLSNWRYDPAINLWYGTKALAEGMILYGDPYETYARYYNPGGEVAGERVLAWYRWLRSLSPQAASSEQGTSTVAGAGPAVGGTR